MRPELRGQSLCWDIAEPLIASGTTAGLGYSEHLSLLDFGPGLCFAAFEPAEGDDWQFVERIDPTDIERLRAIAAGAYRFGRSGTGDPTQPVDWVDAYPPLRLEDIWRRNTQHHLLRPQHRPRDNRQPDRTRPLLEEMPTPDTWWYVRYGAKLVISRPAW